MKLNYNACVQAQLKRVVSYPPILYAAVATLIPIVITLAISGMKISTGNSEGSTVVPAHGLIFSVYIASSAGAFYANMDRKNNEGVFLGLCIPHKNTQTACRLLSALILVFGVCFFDLLLFLLSGIFQFGTEYTPWGKIIAFPMAALLFFLLGLVLADLLRNVLVPIAIVFSFPIILMPLLDRVVPTINEALPWGVAHQLLLGNSSALNWLYAAVWIGIFAVFSWLLTKREQV